MAKPSLFHKYPADKRFEKALEELAYRQSMWTVFTDFLDFTMLMLRWWDVKEEMFADLMQKYPETKQHHLFAEAYSAIADIAQGPETEEGKGGFIDPFGNYFMEHFSNDRAGQFFTPEHLCDMTAKMMIGPDSKDGETVCDPCCGSGRMLLSAAKINRRMKFYAADIDIVCVKMTVINFMLNSMAGEVAHMNTLSMEIWKSYKISLIPYNDHLLPMYIELEPHQSTFKERIRATFEPEVPKEMKPFTIPTIIKQPVIQTTLF